MTIYVNGSPHDEYFVQQVPVDYSLKDLDRLAFIGPAVLGKKVLHVGFVDWPITDPGNSLHLKLSKITKQLDGFDVNREGAEHLTVSNGKNYFSWDDVPDGYDVILCSEVLEHADNVSGLLKEMDKRADKLVITVPCAHRCQRFFQVDDEFLEVVHPDHNCWYSPYTLKNTIEKYTTRKVDKVWFVGSMSVGVIA